MFLAEVGDYCDELVEQGYMSTLRLLPNQTPELEYKIMEHHREHMYVTVLHVNDVTSMTYYMQLLVNLIDPCGPRGQ